MYAMLKKSEEDYKIIDNVGSAKKLLEQEIDKKRIEPLIGLGFAILSEDMLNVARWDTEYPIVIKNQVYGYKKNDLRTAELLDIGNAGSFCIWELGIVDHEKNAWKRYLESERTERDKERYLDSMIEGDL
jgi:hypothetical protein